MFWIEIDGLKLKLISTFDKHQSHICDAFSTQKCFLFFVDRKLKVDEILKFDCMQKTHSNSETAKKKKKVLTALTFSLPLMTRTISAIKPFFFSTLFVIFLKTSKHYFWGENFIFLSFNNSNLMLGSSETKGSDWITQDGLQMPSPKNLRLPGLLIYGKLNVSLY